MDLDSLFKQVILEHYKNPLNKGLINDNSYISSSFKNPSCGDQLTLQIKVQDDTIIDCRHDGSGCSICCASASILSDVIKNKNVTQAKKMIDEFSRLVLGEKVDPNILNGEVLAFSSISTFPARIKCATLSWKSLEKGLGEI
ncbi:MAG: SUF system NifU family Fe-S cluster assembly protein [Acholeplasmatales bacterium]|jgi:nitrogen fixation NifU-like protein|nr:SUF system NifU family Fe-S cluster assembly protein [Acholeplasmatales bacterium]